MKKLQQILIFIKIEIILSELKVNSISSDAKQNMQKVFIPSNFKHWKRLNLSELNKNYDIWSYLISKYF